MGDGGTAERVLCKYRWKKKYIVYIFTIYVLKTHFYHRKSSKRDIPPEIIAKACIIR